VVSGMCRMDLLNPLTRQSPKRWMRSIVAKVRVEPRHAPNSPSYLAERSNLKEQVENDSLLNVDPVNHNLKITRLLVA